MIHRPAIPMAACLCAGILVGRFLLGSLAAWSVLLGIALVGFVCAKSIRFPLLMLIVAALGGVLYSARYSLVSSSDLRLLVHDEAKIVTVRGRLLHTPELRLTRIAGKEFPSTTARIRAKEIELDGAWVPASGEVAVILRGEPPVQSYRGEELLLNGVIKPPAPPTIPGIFDFRKYLYHQRIFYQLNLDAPENWQLVEVHGRAVPWSDRFVNWARQRMAMGVPSGVVLDLLWSMVLGWKTGFTQEVAEPYMKTGTVHIFAISGLHVACLAGFLMFLLRLFALPWHVSSWVVIPILWFYTMATGWQPSAVRSAIMGTVVMLGWGLKRPPDLVNSLSLAGLIILAVEPEQLFQVSFQLSFVVVGSIALFGPHIARWTEFWLKQVRPDPLVPKELWPRHQKYLDKLVRFLAVTMLVSLAAWLGALPISAAYFNLFTPVTLLANVVAVPCSSLSLGFTTMALLVGWWDWAAGICNMNAWFWMAVVQDFNNLLINFGNWYVPKPHWSVFACYYILLAGLLAGLINKTKWKLAVIAIPALFGGIALWHGLTKWNTTVLTILPITGTPIHIDAPGWGEDMLVDCSDELAAARSLKPYLRAKGVNTLGTLLLTHGDIDHVEGFDIAAREFAPGQVVKSSAGFRSPTYKRITAQLQKSGNFLEVNRGDTVNGWKVLHPSAGDKSTRADDKAVVLYGALRGVSVLLLSDLSSVGRNRLLNQYPALKADIVIAGVPEDSKPLNREFLERVGARVCVLGTVASSRGFQIKPPWLSDLEKAGLPVWLTSEVGGVTFRIADGGCEVETMSGTAISMSVQNEGRQGVKSSLSGP